LHLYTTDLRLLQGAVRMLHQHFELILPVSFYIAFFCPSRNIQQDSEVMVVKYISDPTHLTMQSHHNHHDHSIMKSIETRFLVRSQTLGNDGYSFTSGPRTTRVTQTRRRKVKSCPPSNRRVTRPPERHAHTNDNSVDTFHLSSLSPVTVTLPPSNSKMS
jgi:hypothetical protein